MKINITPFLKSTLISITILLCSCSTTKVTINKAKNPKVILMPLPLNDFDPTETAMSWKILKEAGHKVIFATPNGKSGLADQLMLTGEGLGLFKSFLVAEESSISAYKQMEQDESFKHPKVYKELDHTDFDALLLPGGHAPRMRAYLESKDLQQLTANFFQSNKPIAAICHGVVLAARSINKETNKSILYGRKVTALTESSELTAWKLTKSKVGDYYRTYPETVQSEVTRALGNKEDFKEGPFVFLRDSLTNIDRGFVVKDKNLLTARWPGDVHKFAITFLKMLE